MDIAANNISDEAKWFNNLHEFRYVVLTVMYKVFMELFDHLLDFFGKFIWVLFEDELNVGLRLLFWWFLYFKFDTALVCWMLWTNKDWYIAFRDLIRSNIVVWWSRFPRSSIIYWFHFLLLRNLIDLLQSLILFIKKKALSLI